MKPFFVLTLALLLGSQMLQAQTTRRSTTATAARRIEPTTEQTAARARTRQDSIQKVQALAREMARQMMAEDSVRRARLAGVEAAKTAAEQPVAKKSTQPETTRQTIASAEPVRTQSVSTAPKGVISIGPSVQFNSELETTLIGGSVGLGYAVGRKVGVLVAADYHTGNHTAVFSTIGTTLTESYTTSSITLRPEFRFYPRRSFEGFFIGLNGTLMSYKAGGFKSNKLIVNSETAGGGGLVMGVNIATPSRLNFEFGIAGAIITGANDEVIVGSGALRIGYVF
ncbi:DUF3575 domain-containing protein [Spirosoma validum]|uniref:DUF3575 domain-containing protein n=1 Tax=Spirosoma validum TaxID=2771355 RepID=A0A927GF12_9BACT|nr:DUF3575 domain-containing protein [Spirosoma validum]MBD2755364.1 DUF3575 domain-containing protein [Spirosoma validum]